MKRAKEKGFDVYVGPETATILFNSGYEVPPDSSQEEKQQLKFNFQFNLTELQLALERSLTNIASRTGRPSIIVFDRGILDTRGYLTESEFEYVISHCNRGKGLTLDDCLKRYDGVVHLVTAADGAEDFYKYDLEKQIEESDGSKMWRRETPEQARSLDLKMQQCWYLHPKHKVVVNRNGKLRGSISREISREISLVKSVRESLVKSPENLIKSVRENILQKGNEKVSKKCGGKNP